MASELLSLLQRAPVGSRSLPWGDEYLPDDQVNPFLEALGLAELTGGTRTEPSLPAPVAAIRPRFAPTADAMVTTNAGTTGPGGTDLIAASTGKSALAGAEANTPQMDAASGATMATPPPAPSAPRAMAQQGVSLTGERADAKPAQKIPSVDEIATAWQEVRLITAANPDAAKRWEPRLRALRDLAVARHHQDFSGDPMASPEQAVAYARHMGALGPRFGDPMDPGDAAKWSVWLDGKRAEGLSKAKQAITQGNLAQINQHLPALMGEGWQATGVEQGRYAIGNMEVPAHVVTLVGPDGQPRTINSVEFELAQAGLETKIKLAEARRKAQEEQAGQPTRKLQGENEQIKAEIENARLKQLRDNQQASATTDMTKLQEKQFEAWKELRKEILKDPTLDAQTRETALLRHDEAYRRSGLGDFIPGMGPKAAGAQNPQAQTPYEQTKTGLFGTGGSQAPVAASEPPESAKKTVTEPPKGLLDEVTTENAKEKTNRQVIREAAEREAKLDQSKREAVKVLTEAEKALKYPYQLDKVMETIKKLDQAAGLLTAENREVAKELMKRLVAVEQMIGKP